MLPKLRQCLYPGVCHSPVQISAILDSAHLQFFRGTSSIPTDSDVDGRNRQKMDDFQPGQLSSWQKS
ncbi:hypothetical protein M8J77_006295 [Diaphorina citri]|nr:hypothetical protein M8J77_006295 [Diaphorina citri]